LKPRHVADGSGARLIPAALLAVLAAVTLAACGSSKRPITAASPTTTAAAPQTTERRPSATGAANVQLTRSLRLAYWGHAAYAAEVHAKPETESPAIASLHFKTEDGFPEVYLVLRRLVRPPGEVWVKIAVPRRPNGTIGWVPRNALGSLHRVTTWLVIDRTRLRLFFFDGGRRLWQAPVGIGKPDTPTPRGLFWIREEFVLPDQAFYGPYAFGTSAYSSLSEWPGGGVVGLHGTNAPRLIPGRPSHGCIRLRNPDILWLARHVPVGTPISIVN
jgi:hypothetical protein